MPLCRLKKRNKMMKLHSVSNQGWWKLSTLFPFVICMLNYVACTQSSLNTVAMVVVPHAMLLYFSYAGFNEE